MPASEGQQAIGRWARRRLTAGNRTGDGEMANAAIRTLADLLRRLGVPADRVRFQPSPGQATALAEM